MDPKPDDAWYYSKGGERKGPLSFSQMQEIVQGGTLDPMKDLIWKQGMEKWKKVGEIANQFAAKPTSEEKTKPAEEPAKVEEKKEPQAEPIKETLTPEPKPEPKPEEPTKPAAKPAPKPAAVIPKKKVTTFDKAEPTKEVSKEKKKKEKQPGVGRFGYFFMTFVAPFLFIIGLGALLAAIQEGMEQSMISAITFGAMLLFTLIVIIVKLMRLTNLSMSRWWFLIGFVPVLNIWLEYRCFACPPNYANTKDLDGTGIVLAVVFWLSILVTVIAFGAIILLFYGLMNDPESAKQILETIRAKAEAGGSMETPEPIPDPATPPQ